MTRVAGASGDIVVAQFDDFESAQAARTDLRALGVGEADTEVFQLNAPGQHDAYPIGGDQHTDEGARGGERGAGSGAAVGAAAGLAVGAAAVPVVGPLAAVAGVAAGAYVGSLRGAVGTMGDEGEAAAQAAPDRPAGVRLAVHVADAVSRDACIDLLHRHGTRSIELAHGAWNAGWTDFDPLSKPNWLEAPAPR